MTPKRLAEVARHSLSAVYVPEPDDTGLTPLQLGQVRQTLDHITTGCMHGYGPEGVVTFDSGLSMVHNHRGDYFLSFHARVIHARSEYTALWVGTHRNDSGVPGRRWVWVPRDLYVCHGVDPYALHHVVDGTMPPRWLPRYLLRNFYMTFKETVL